MSEPRPKHKRPTAEEMDERLSVPLDPEELVEGILQAGPSGAESDDEGSDQAQ